MPLNSRDISKDNMDLERVFLINNNFQETLNKAFSDIKRDITFADVTLVCEDGRPILAHKVILSVSSPLFRNLLEQNKHPHPLIYMRRIRSSSLLAIIDFIYLGKTEIPKENLEKFLALAEELKIHGLVEMQTLIKLQNETVPIQDNLKCRQKEERQNLTGKIWDFEEKHQKEEADHQFEIIEGNKGPGAENPGKLVVDNEYKFLFSQKYKNSIYYHCYKKNSIKCTAKAKVTPEDGPGNDVKYKLVGLENEHNHQSQWGLLLAQKIQREMKSELMTGLHETPQTVVELVIEKYRLMYGGEGPDHESLWNHISENLPDYQTMVATLKKHTYINANPPKWRLVKGQASNPKNPGILVIENRFRYHMDRMFGEEGNMTYFFQCSDKNCKGRASLVDKRVDEKDGTVLALANWLPHGAQGGTQETLEDTHNHEANEAKETAKEIKKEFIKFQQENPDIAPDTCRKTVLRRYKEIFQDDLAKWEDISANIGGKSSIQRLLRRYRATAAHTKVLDACFGDSNL